MELESNKWQFRFRGLEERVCTWARHYAVLTLNDVHPENEVSSWIPRGEDKEEQNNSITDLQSSSEEKPDKTGINDKSQTELVGEGNLTGSN